MPRDTLLLICLHVGIALFVLVMVWVQARFRHEYGSLGYRMWAVVWISLALTHLGYSATAWLSPVPGTLRSANQALSLATSLAHYTAATLMVIAIHFVLKGESPSRLPRKLLAGAVVLVVALIGLSSFGAPDPITQDARRYATQLGATVVAATIGGFALLLRRPKKENVPARVLGATLIGYAVPMALYAYYLGRGVGLHPGDHLYDIVAIGALEFVMTAMLAANQAQQALIWERELAGMRASVERSARENLNRSVAHFRALVAHVPAILLAVDANGRFAYDMWRGRKLFGYDEAVWERRTLLELIDEWVHVEDRPIAHSTFQEVARSPGLASTIELRLRHADSQWHVYETTAANRLEVPMLESIVITLLDITDRQNLERRVARAERLEAVGRLAGSVAHDFNNLLTVVHGNAYYLCEQLPADSPHQSMVMEILQAAERGGSITQQLLAYATKQPLAPTVFAIEDLVTALLPILQRICTEEIAIRWNPSGAGGYVRADANRIDQVVVNLVSNARDAMPNGGELRLSTMHTEDRVMLIVEDTGIGMTEEVARRAAEPFFSTKASGTGAGLGLSTSVSIVEQAGGALTLESRVGIGTRLCISFPRMGAPASTVGDTPVVGPASIAREPAAGRHTVLLADDERSVRSVIATALKGAGYEVLEASDGHEALKLWFETTAIACIVTDVVMPKMSGDRFVRQVWRIAPATPVLFTSGYASDFAPGTHGHYEFLQKPFAPDVVVAAVGRLLQRAAASEN